LNRISKFGRGLKTATQLEDYFPIIEKSVIEAVYPQNRYRTALLLLDKPRVSCGVTQGIFVCLNEQMNAQSIGISGQTGSPHVQNHACK
jgi:hypothetical protein